MTLVNNADPGRARLKTLSPRGAGVGVEVGIGTNPDSRHDTW
jgi:hypothetical protein